MIASREVYQCLRDAALGVATLMVVDEHWVYIDGWRLRLVLDDDGLAYCSQARSPDGRQAGLVDWPRYGTNPVDHLSLWERQQIEQRLAGQCLLDEVQPVLTEEHLLADKAGGRAK